jgi:heat shock protein HtpX
MPSATTRATTALLLALVALCAVATLFCGGSTVLVVGLGGIVALNGAAYWCSDRLVCALMRARPLRPGDAPHLRALVAELAARAGMPVPRIAVIDTAAPDALYTGRDPAHAVILVTTGLLAHLDARAVRGVLAHELAHIRGRDTLLGTVAMTLAIVSAAVAGVEQIMALVGRPDADTLAQLLVAPLAALLLQRAVSRTREYAADTGSARLNGDALALADALGAMARAWPPPPSGCRGEWVRRLFRTHPPLAARIARLRASHLAAPPRRGVPAGPAL